MSVLEPLPDGIPDAAAAAFFDERGTANVEAAMAGLSGWERERYAIIRGLAAALQRVGCAGLYDGGQCPCYQAGRVDAADDATGHAGRDPSG